MAAQRIRAKHFLNLQRQGGESPAHIRVAVASHTRTPVGIIGAPVREQFEPLPRRPRRDRRPRAALLGSRFRSDLSRQLSSLRAGSAQLSQGRMPARSTPLQPDDRRPAPIQQKLTRDPVSASGHRNQSWPREALFYDPELLRTRPASPPTGLHHLYAAQHRTVLMHVHKDSQLRRRHIHKAALLGCVR